VPQALHLVYRGFGTQRSVTKDTLLVVSGQAVATFCCPARQSNKHPCEPQFSRARWFRTVLTSEQRLPISFRPTQDLLPGLLSVAPSGAGDLV